VDFGALELVPIISNHAVMPGLVPGIHVLPRAQTWMAGTSPAMTPRVDQYHRDKP
jgi:hypothetical protein